MEPYLRQGVLEPSTYVTFVSCTRIHIDYLGFVDGISGLTVLGVGSMCEAPSFVRMDALEAASSNGIIDGIIPGERQEFFLARLLRDPQQCQGENSLKRTFRYACWPLTNSANSTLLPPGYRTDVQ